MSALTKWEKLKANKFAIDFSNSPSLTKQSELPSTDVNKILERFEKTGILPREERQALYGDFSNVPTFMEAFDIVQRAEEQFANLPAAVRQRFANDPENMLRFVETATQEQLVEVGLAEAPEPDEPLPPQERVPTPPKGKQGPNKPSQKPARDAGDGDSGET